MAVPKKRPPLGARSINLLLAAAAVSIGVGLGNAALNAGPYENSLKKTTDISHNVPPSGELTPSQIIDLNLRKPNSRLLSDLRDMYDRNGQTVQFFDCSNDQSSVDNTVVSPVMLREAPSRISKAIGELEVGEQVTSPVEVAVNSLYRKSPMEKWIAQIHGTDLTFNAREDAYRRYIVLNWQLGQYCTPIPTDDYLRVDPAPNPPK